MEPQNTSADLILVIVAIVAFLTMFGLYVWSLIWLYADAQKRGNIGCLMVILVAIFAWPLGLLVWLFARPAIRYR